MKTASPSQPAGDGLFPSVSDGGTAWLSQESFSVDEADSGAGAEWKNVARQLKEDLSSIILLSEEDLQVSLPSDAATPLAPAAPHTSFGSMRHAIILSLLLNFQILLN